MLTPEETKWIKRVQRALDACPSDDLGFFTIGDKDVTVYRRPNGDFADHCDDFCTTVQDADANLGFLTFPREVHSTAG